MLAEVDRLRARLLPAHVAPPPPRGPAGAAFVGRVVSSSNGLGAGKFIKVNPWRTVAGTEAEGGSGTIDVDTGTAEVVYFLGPGSLATGDDLVCRFVPYRWVARKKGGGSACVTLAVHVTGCGSLPLAGMQVTFTKTGAPTVVVTTDASGNATALLTVAGTWTYSTSKTRWNNTTGFNNYTCSGASQGFTLNMGSGVTNAATGFHCTNLCADPTAGTLTFSDGINPALTLTNGAGAPAVGGWIACATRTVTGPALRNCATGTTGTVATAYGFDGANLVMYQPVMDTNGDGVMDHLCTGITCSQLMQILNGFLSPGSTGCGSFDTFNGQIQASTLQPAPTATGCTAGSMAFQAAFTTESSAATLVSWASIYGASTAKTFTISE